MSEGFKKRLHFVGRCLGILGVVFILYRLFERGDPRLFGEISANVWLSILLLGLLYFVSNFLLAFSWQHILNHCGSSVSRQWAVHCYGISQLAKYVPGNIFHLAGRQAIGMSYGLPGMSLVKSSFWELSLLSYSGLLYLILVSIHWIPNFSPTGSGIFFLASAVVSLLAIGRFLGRSLAAAFGFYIIFLAISALLFSAVLFMAGNVIGLGYFEWVYISASFVVAWLCGLLTPGAPAGVGVREVVLLMLVGTLVPEDHLLIAVILGRLVTMIGDFGFYLWSATVTLPPSAIRNSSDDNSTTTQTDTL